MYTPNCSTSEGYYSNITNEREREQAPSKSSN
jgi:hypothetical protein